MGSMCANNRDHGFFFPLRKLLHILRKGAEF